MAKKIMMTLIILLALTTMTIPTHAYLSTQPPTQQEWDSGNIGNVLDIAWDPAGDRIAAGTGWYDWNTNTSHGKVIVFSQSGDLIWESDDLGDDVSCVAWSPDGTKLAVGTDYPNNRVYVFSQDGQELWRSGDLGDGVNSVAWSPDGDLIAVGTDWSRIIIFDNMGNQLWENDDLAAGISHIKWNPAGDKFVAGTDSGIVIVFSYDGTQLWESEDLDGAVNSVAWNPDGSMLAVGTGYPSNKVYVFSQTGELLWEKDLGDDVYSVAWSPTGDKLAVGINYYEHGRVYVFSQSGEMLWESGYLGGSIGTGDLYSVAWNSQGTMLATGVADRIIVFSPNGTQLWESGDLDGNVLKVAWNPEGPILAAGTTGGRLYVFGIGEFGVLRVTGPPGTTIHISGVGGSGNYTIPDNGTIILYANPGTYRITSPDTGWSTTVTVGPPGSGSETVNIEIPADTVSSPDQGDVQPPSDSRTQDQTVGGAENKTSPPPPEPGATNETASTDEGDSGGLPKWLIVIGAIGIVVIIIALAIAIRR